MASVDAKYHACLLTLYTDYIMCISLTKNDSWSWYCFHPQTKHHVEHKDAEHAADKPAGQQLHLNSHPCHLLHRALSSPSFSRTACCQELGMGNGQPALFLRQSQATPAPGNAQWFDQSEACGGQTGQRCDHAGRWVRACPWPSCFHCGTGTLVSPWLTLRVLLSSVCPWPSCLRCGTGTFVSPWLALTPRVFLSSVCPWLSPPLWNRYICVTLAYSYS